MIIEDHLNFIPDNPLRGPNIDEWGLRFPDLSVAYDRGFIELAYKAAEKLGLRNVVSGVYGAIPGPSLETPAETRYLRNCGIDAVGMSTVPEVIVARHASMRVLGLSVIANVNDPDRQKPIVLEEVVACCRAASVALADLVAAVVSEI
jgi:purine-nucleoside phosphorylase